MRHASAKCPLSGSPPEHVEVQVGHGVHGVGPDVEDEAVAPVGPGHPGRLGHGPGGQQHVGQDGTVLGGDGRRVVDVAPGHDQHVQRRGRVDVLEGHRGLGLVHDVGRHLARHDPAEEAVGHASASPPFKGGRGARAGPAGCGTTPCSGRRPPA